MAQMVGYVVGTTDAAMAFVAESDAGKAGIRPLWLPRKKILAAKESDAMGKRIETDKGERIGILFNLNVCDEFLEKIKAKSAA
jgi:hypothetical protein